MKVLKEETQKTALSGMQIKQKYDLHANVHVSTLVMRSVYRQCVDSNITHKIVGLVLICSPTCMEVLSPQDHSCKGKIA